MRSAISRSDEGAGAVWVLCMCLVLWSSGIGLLAYGTGVAARHRAAAAADLAVLAAADRLLAHAPQPCAAAAAVAAVHDARLVSCDARSSAVQVVVAVPHGLGRWRMFDGIPLPPVTARAAAGATSR